MMRTSREKLEVGRPAMLQGPAALAALLRGIGLMTALVRPTLGPVARTVAIARLDGPAEPPEVLDNAATIARRTIQLPDPFLDMGAMIVRHLIWRVFETAGDGGATAAVLSERLVREAARYIAAGGNPIPIKRGIEQGLDVVVEALERQSRPIDLPEEIAGLVSGLVRDASLSETVGEIMDSVGPDGAVVFEHAAGLRTSYDYLEGVQWSEGYVSHYLLRDGESTARLLDPCILLTDHTLERAEQVVPALEACLAAGGKSLLVVAADVRDAAVGVLVLNREKGLLENVLAVKAPAAAEQRTRILEDIAVLTGGRCVREKLNERLEEVQPGDLGRARQAWATSTAFGILGGSGDRAAIRQRLSLAKGELTVSGLPEYDRQKIRERIGKLAGTGAIVRVGAPSQSEREELKLRLEAAVQSARLALQEGVVPGGGAALVACIPALDSLRLHGDEAMGVEILARTLTEPMRSIARNAGAEPDAILHQARLRGSDWTYDAIQHEWVSPWKTGLLDPLAVVRTALQTGVSAAATALTSEVLVHRRKPPVEYQP